MDQSGNDEAREIAQSRLTVVAAKVAETLPGENRNAALNKGAFSMGGLVACSLLSESEVLNSLLSACDENGYNADYRDARRVILAGLSEGINHPSPITTGALLDDVFDDDQDDAHADELDRTDAPAKATQKPVSVMRRKNGDPEATAHNAIIYLGRANEENDLRIQHNEFTGQYEWRSGQIRDADLTLIRVEVERAGMRNVGDNLTNRAVRAVAERNKYHPIRDWLISLEHDGVQRLETWLSDYIGAEDTPYTQAAGRATLIALVARVMRPGCKHDHVLTLTGALEFPRFDGHFQRWSRKFGPAFKVDRMTKETIQNGKEKELFTGV